MVSVATLLQRIDGADHPIPEINMHSNTVNRVSEEGSALQYPIIVTSDGAFTSSRILTFRLRLEPPFTYVHSAQLWFDPFPIPTGWDLRVSVHASDNPSASVPGRPITDFMTPVGLDVLPAPFNLMPGYSTLDYPAASCANTPESGTFHSPFVHLWARANRDAAPGPVLGYNPDGSPKPMPVHITWVEL